MGINRWLEYLEGIVTIRLRGPYPEKIINLILARGYLLMGVKKDGSDLLINMRTSGYRALRNLVEETEYDLEVVRADGLPFYKRMILNRGMLLIGAFLFVMGLYFMSSFIWFLDIAGTRNVSPLTVQKCAEGHGLYPWAAKRNIARNRIEQEILKEIPLLSYVQIDIRGVRATIKVVEKVLPDEQWSGPCHLVATKGGIIEDIIALDGHIQVQKGDTVGTGEVLISGVITPPVSYVEPEGHEPVPQLVRARGRVMARVFYEGYGEHPLETEKAVLTGAQKKRITLETPYGHWVLGGQGFPFTSSRVLPPESIKFNTPWGGVKFTRQTWLETRIKNTQFSEHEALERAKAEAMANLKKRVKGVEKVYQTTTRVVSSPSDTMIRVKVTAEVIEDISGPQPINIEENMQ